MGFWSTVLAALRFKAGQVPVFTAPMQIHRLRFDSFLVRPRLDTKTVHRVLNNVDVAHRLRVEAR